MTYELDISKQYPSQKFNLLGNTAVMTKIPDIMSPVVQVITISTDPSKGETYVQQKGYQDRNGTSHPALYAIAKNGLKKLADGAGITMVASEHVLPTSCEKCVAANRAVGTPAPCGTCRNRDIAYRVTIAVPQLTGDTIRVTDTNEILFQNLTFHSDKEREQFTKFAPQICEAKALNGAIRTALHIKGTYTAEELARPFVVAYLVPNLDQPDVKQRVLDNMFASSAALYGTASKPVTTDLVEGKAPDTPMLETPTEQDQEVIDSYVDAPANNAPAQQNSGELPWSDEDPEPQYQESQYQQRRQQAPRMQSRQSSANAGYRCQNCGRSISQDVFDYSMKHYNRALCLDCQRGGRR